MDFIPQLSQEKDDSTRIEQLQKQNKEYHLVGKQRKTAGHTLFEFDRKTKEIRHADISRQAAVGMDGNVRYQTRMDVHSGCFYIQALNKKNAEKKLRKMGLL